MLPLALLLQAAEPPLPPLAPLEHITRLPCAEATNGEVVVCGGRQDRYRLPFPIEREPSNDTDATRAAAGSGVAAITPPGRCGIFAGERRCGKAEAKRYGYGGGRDPITVLGKLAKKASGLE